MKEKGDGADGTLRCERGKEMSKYDASERFRTLIRQKTALFYDENLALNRYVFLVNATFAIALEAPGPKRYTV
jgi:hypothetical protein